MNRIGRSAIALAAVAAVSGVANADTWDNSVVSAPIVNNGITVDGNLGDWGTAGTNYTQFSAWNQWYDGSYDNGHSAPGPNSTTTSRVAIDTVNNRLILGVQTNDPAASFEIQGLFGDTNTLHGQTVRRQNFQGQLYPNTGTQLFFELPATNTLTAGDSGTFVDVDPETWAPGTIGAYEVYRNGVPDGGTVGNPAFWGDVTGITGAYSYDGTNISVELSIPVKLDWALSDSSASNTYDLNDIAGLDGGTGAGDLNIAYSMSMFARNEGYVGDGQNARFDTVAGTYGNAIGNLDYWEYKAVNIFGTGPNSDQFGPDQYGLSGWNNQAGYGGLTLLGTPIPIPEPASLGLLGLGALGLVRRRKNA